MYNPEQAAAILRRSHEVRADGGSRHMEWGAMQLYWPPGHREAMGKKYPDLDSPDPDIQLKAFKKFLNSPESAPYKVFRPKFF